MLSRSTCLVGIEDAAERWELIAAVWVEMLCYLALRCGAEFHARHLSTGGELATHVRILMINLGTPAGLVRIENRAIDVLNL